MKLINFVRDNVIRLPRNPSGTGFPTCHVCWQPVEAYELVDEGIDFQDLRASCSHKTSTVHQETKRVTMHWYWTNNRRNTEASKLVFFVPSAAEPMADTPGA